MANYENGYNFTSKNTPKKHFHPCKINPENELDILCEVVCQQH